MLLCFERSKKCRPLLHSTLRLLLHLRCRLMSQLYRADVPTPTSTLHRFLHPLLQVDVPARSEAKDWPLLHSTTRLLLQYLH
jgi:hypothetical protein